MSVIHLLCGYFSMIAVGIIFGALAIGIIYNIVMLILPSKIMEDNNDKE